MENSKNGSPVGTLLVWGWGLGWFEMKLERCVMVGGGQTMQRVPCWQWGGVEILSSEQGDCCWRILARE